MKNFLTTTLIFMLAFCGLAYSQERPIYGNLHVYGTTTLDKRAKLKVDLEFADGSVQNTAYMPYSDTLSWLAPVKSFHTDTLCNSGDSTYRYIANATSGSFVINHIHECNGTSWSDYAPQVGDAVTVIDSGKVFVFDGINWKASTNTQNVYWVKSGTNLFNTNGGSVLINKTTSLGSTYIFQVQGNSYFSGTIEGIKAVANNRLILSDYFLRTKDIVPFAGICFTPYTTNSSSINYMSGKTLGGIQRFYTKGILALTIDSSQRVGIGTSPKYKLDVNGVARLGHVKYPTTIGTQGQTLIFNTADSTLNWGTGFDSTAFLSACHESLRLDTLKGCDGLEIKGSYTNVRPTSSFDVLSDEYSSGLIHVDFPSKMIGIGDWVSDGNATSITIDEGNKTIVNNSRGSITNVVSGQVNSTTLIQDTLMLLLTSNNYQGGLLEVDGERGIVRLGDYEGDHNGNAIHISEFDDRVDICGSFINEVSNDSISIHSGASSDYTSGINISEKSLVSRSKGYVNISTITQDTSSITTQIGETHSTIDKYGYQFYTDGAESAPYLSLYRQDNTHGLGTSNISAGFMESINPTLL